MYELVYIYMYTWVENVSDVVPRSCFSLSRTSVKTLPEELEVSVAAGTVCLGRRDLMKAPFLGFGAVNGNLESVT